MNFSIYRLWDCIFWAVKANSRPDSLRAVTTHTKMPFHSENSAATMQLMMCFFERESDPSLLPQPRNGASILSRVTSSRAPADTMSLFLSR
jgi:hypothetical protein